MKENCIICGKETQYDINTHIDLRNNYIEGAGQLCNQCVEEKSYFKPKKIDDKKGVFISNEQIKRIPNDFQLGLYVRMLYLDSLE